MAAAILSLIFSFLTYAQSTLASDDPNVVQLQNLTADPGSESECADVPDGSILFHFVANNLSTDSELLSFDAQFDPSTPSTFEARVINSTVTHIDVVIGAGASLTGSSATFDRPQPTGPSGAKLVLSHVCDKSQDEGPPPTEGTPNVTVAKEASVSSVDRGGSFTYTLTVENKGDATATSVKLTDPTLDAEMTLSGVVASQGSCTITDNNLACDLSDLAAGASATVTFMATVHDDACPSLRNTARVSAGNEPLENAGDNRSNEVIVLVNGCGRALNGSIVVLKVDEDGKPLPGAVFTVEGQEGTFVTGPDGKFCVTGLPVFTDFVVTEIKAPAGFRIGETASQTVRDDHDGDCDSPEATFVNLRNSGTQGGGGGPKPKPTPKPTHQGTKSGGHPGPGVLPNTAVPFGGQPPVALLSLALLVALGATGSLNAAAIRSRRR